MLLAVDHCLLWAGEMADLLATISRQTGLPTERLLVAFSHTHAAGLMDRTRAELPGGEMIAPYLAELADKLQARGAELRTKYAMRLPTVTDRLAERFVRPMVIDRVRALVKPAMDEARHHLAYRRFIEKMDDDLEDIDLGTEMMFDTLLASDDPLTLIATEQFFLESFAMNIFEREQIDFVMLAAALVAVAVFAVLVRRAWRWWPLLIPVAIAAWGLMHASGVHATVAGVLLGFTVPAVAIRGEKQPRTERLDDAVRPYSAAIALPVFAFAAAGVSVVGGEGSIVQPVSIGIVVGLVLGKVVGVMGSTWLMTRFTPLRLPDAVGLRDLLPVGLLTGVGFTVALLIAELSFEAGSDDHAAAAKAAILAGSVASAILAAILLRWDARQARDPDMNRDNIPDIDKDVIGG